MSNLPDELIVCILNCIMREPRRIATHKLSRDWRTYYALNLTSRQMHRIMREYDTAMDWEYASWRVPLPWSLLTRLCANDRIYVEMIPQLTRNEVPPKHLVHGYASRLRDVRAFGTLPPFMGLDYVQEMINDEEIIEILIAPGVTSRADWPKICTAITSDGRFVCTPCVLHTQKCGPKICTSTSAHAIRRPLPRDADMMREFVRTNGVSLMADLFYVCAQDGYEYVSREEYETKYYVPELLPFSCAVRKHLEHFLRENPTAAYTYAKRHPDFSESLCERLCIVDTLLSHAKSKAVLRCPCEPCIILRPNLDHWPLTPQGALEELDRPHVLLRLRNLPALSEKLFRATSLTDIFNVLLYIFLARRSLSDRFICDMVHNKKYFVSTQAGSYMPGWILFAIWPKLRNFMHRHQDIYGR